MLYVMPYVHPNPDHNNRTTYSILERNRHVPMMQMSKPYKKHPITNFSS